MSEIKVGDRVRWEYEHCIGRSYHTVVKRGVVKRFTRDGRRAVVRFDSNRTDSYVPLRDLVAVPSRRKAR